MPKISFCTPIIREYGTLSKTGKRFCNFVENFFYFGGRKAIRISQDTIIVREYKQKIYITILKIIACLTVIIPLFFLYAKLMCRYSDELINKLKVIKAPNYNPFDRLPNEVQLNIFKFLDAESIAQVSRTCSDFSAVANDPEIVKRQMVAGLYKFAKKIGSQLYTDRVKAQICLAEIESMVGFYKKALKTFSEIESNFAYFSRFWNDDFFVWFLKKYKLKIKLKPSEFVSGALIKLGNPSDITSVTHKLLVKCQMAQMGYFTKEGSAFKTLEKLKGTESSDEYALIQMAKLEAKLGLKEEACYRLKEMMREWSFNRFKVDIGVTILKDTVKLLAKLDKEEALTIVRNKIAPLDPKLFIDHPQMMEIYHLIAKLDPAAAEELREKIGERILLSEDSEEIKKAYIFALKIFTISLNQENSLEKCKEKIIDWKKGCEFLMQFKSKPWEVIFFDLELAIVKRSCSLIRTLSNKKWRV